MLNYGVRALIFQNQGSFPHTLYVFQRQKETGTACVFVIPAISPTHTTVSINSQPHSQGLSSSQRLVTKGREDDKIHQIFTCSTW